MDLVEMANHPETSVPWRCSGTLASRKKTGCPTRSDAAEPTWEAVLQRTARGDLKSGDDLFPSRMGKNDRPSWRMP